MLYPCSKTGQFYRFFLHVLSGVFKLSYDLAVLVTFCVSGMYSFRVYCGAADVTQYGKEFKHVKIASAACPHGTIGLTLSYRSTLTLHGDRWVWLSDTVC